MNNDPFKFDFNSVNLDQNAIDSFPFDVPLPAVITGVAYRNLAKKDSGEEKIRLIITQNVYHEDAEAVADTIISPAQTFLMKQYLIAAGVDANSLSNQSLDEEGLSSLLVDKPIYITYSERTWEGKTFRNVKKVVVNDD